MDEFAYFTKEIILEKSTFNLSWEINIPGNPDFRELTIRFSRCIASFECNLMNYKKDDRSLVAGVVLDDIITAMVNADLCAYENIPTPRNVACLCMAFHNGVRNLLDHLNKLNVSIPDLVIQRMIKLTNSLLVIRKKDNDKIIEEEVKSPYGLIFGLYLRKYKGQEQDLGKYKGQEQEVEFPKELNTNEARDLFDKLEWCTKDGSFYKWKGTSALFGYFVDLASDKLNVRPSNGRLPWKIFKIAFQRSKSEISTSQQAVNDYKNKGISEPEGSLELKKACK